MGPVDDASSARPAAAIDVWTVAAIGVAACAIADLIHEGGGHGGACLLVGGKPQALTSTFFSHHDEAVSRTALRVVAAGGSVLNTIIGLPLAWLSRRELPARLRFFVWLFAAYNLLTAFGYLLFSAVGGAGDWAAVIEGVPHQKLWRLLEAVAGAILYFYAAPWLLLPGLKPFVGGGADRERRARILTLVPYLCGGAASTLSGALNPMGIELVLISSVASSFGGASLLAWFFPMWARKHAGDAPSLGIERSWGWIGFGALVLAIFVGVFGRGLTF